MQNTGDDFGGVRLSCCDVINIILVWYLYFTLVSLFTIQVQIHIGQRQIVGPGRIRMDEGVIGGSAAKLHHFVTYMQVAQVLSKGFSALPKYCWISILCMFILGVTLPCLNLFLRRSQRWLHLAPCVNTPILSNLKTMFALYFCV